MTTQIAVRLPDDLVRFVDEQVGYGRAVSRAAVIARALERERRHEMAMADIAVLSQRADDHDLDELAEFASRTRLDDLD